MGQVLTLGMLFNLLCTLLVLPALLPGPRGK
jgi:predicted RND superfamily exporter protein